MDIIKFFYRRSFEDQGWISRKSVVTENQLLLYYGLLIMHIDENNYIHVTQKHSNIPDEINKRKPLLTLEAKKPVFIKNGLSYIHINDLVSSRWR